MSIYKHNDKKFQRIALSQKSDSKSTSQSPGAKNRLQSSIGRSSLIKLTWVRSFLRVVQTEMTVRVSHFLTFGTDPCTGSDPLYPFPLKLPHKLLLASKIPSEHKLCRRGAKFPAYHDGVSHSVIGHDLPPRSRALARPDSELR
jgi:hypothetical protein